MKRNKNIFFAVWAVLVLGLFSFRPAFSVGETIYPDNRNNDEVKVHYLRNLGKVDTLSVTVRDASGKDISSDFSYKWESGNIGFFRVIRANGLAGAPYKVAVQGISAGEENLYVTVTKGTGANATELFPRVRVHIVSVVESDDASLASIDVGNITVHGGDSLEAPRSLVSWKKTLDNDRATGYEVIVGQWVDSIALDFAVSFPGYFDLPEELRNPAGNPGSPDFPGATVIPEFKGWPAITLLSSVSPQLLTEQAVKFRSSEEDPGDLSAILASAVGSLTKINEYTNAVASVVNSLHALNFGGSDVGEGVSVGTLNDFINGLSAWQIKLSEEVVAMKEVADQLNVELAASPGLVSDQAFVARVVAARDQYFRLLNTLYVSELTEDGKVPYRFITTNNNITIYAGLSDDKNTPGGVYVVLSKAVSSSDEVAVTSTSQGSVTEITVTVKYETENEGNDLYVAYTAFEDAISTAEDQREAVLEATEELAAQAGLKVADDNGSSLNLGDIDDNSKEAGSVLADLADGVDLPASFEPSGSDTPVTDDEPFVDSNGNYLVSQKGVYHAVLHLLDEDEPAKTASKKAVIFYVTAEDGETVHTYTFTVKKQRDIRLTHIKQTIDGKTSVADVKPGPFNPEHNTYTVLLNANQVSKVSFQGSFQATTLFGGESVVANKDDGNGIEWGARTDDKGRVVIETSDEYGQTLQYYITVAARSTDATLAVLATVGGELAPAFEPNTFDYDVKVPESVDKVSFAALAVQGATVVQNNNGHVDLAGVEDGEIFHEIKVIAEDGETEREYTFRLVRVPDAPEKFDLTLRWITINGVEIPGFDPEVHFYDYPLAAGESLEVALGYRVNSGLAYAESETVYSGDRAVITITVKSDDTDETIPYVVNVFRATAISAVALEAVSVSVADRTLNIVSPAETVSIYTVSGKLAATVNKSAGKVSLSNLPKGILVVKGSSGWVKKAVI